MVLGQIRSLLVHIADALKGGCDLPRLQAGVRTGDRIARRLASILLRKKKPGISSYIIDGDAIAVVVLCLN
jgi:hypothetical protein